MKTTFTLTQHMLLVLIILLYTSAATAQVSMGTFETTYTQNFDGLPVTGTTTWASGAQYLPGWVVYRSKGTDLFTGTGSGNTGGLYSYGKTNAKDRALGSVSSSPAGEFSYNLLLHNSTGTTINSIELSYIGEQWRASEVTAGQQKLVFLYAISSTKEGFATTDERGFTPVPSLDFSSPKFFISGGPLDGNAAENRKLFEAVLRIEVPAGHYLMLRWKDYDEPNNDHGLAIDDVSVKWNYDPTTIGPTPLPVELMNFRGRAKELEVELQWQTASEEQNSHFEVERSQNGRSFDKIGSVVGHGTTLQAQHYTFIDASPLAGTAYYRLKQVDEDGTFEYSAVILVKRAPQFTIQVYPTVVEQDLHLRTDTTLSSLMVIDQTGRYVYQQPLNSLSTSHSVNLSHLQQGSYILVLLDETGKRYTKRFIKR